MDYAVAMVRGFFNQTTKNLKKNTAVTFISEEGIR